MDYRVEQLELYGGSWTEAETQVVDTHVVLSSPGQHYLFLISKSL
jgi:hypothetical protein